MDEINIEQSIPQINIDTATHTYHLPIASATTLGGIKVGNNLVIEEDGTLNAESTEYNLPAATSESLGGVIVGSALAIADGVLSVDCDQALDGASSRPVRNSVVTSNISTLTTNLTNATNTITTLSNNYSTLSSTVSSHTSSISSLDDTVSTLSSTVASHTEDISGNTSAITDLSDTVTTQGNSISTIEGDITDINNAMGDISSDVSLLKYQTSESITNSYLLPINTWTGGEITLDRRGKVATLTFNLTCTLTIHNSDVTVYTLTDNIPNANTYGILLTDAGTILCKVDTDGIITLMNPEGDNKTITTVQGQLVILFQ